MTAVVLAPLTRQLASTTRIAWTPYQGTPMATTILAAAASSWAVLPSPCSSERLTHMPRTGCSYRVGRRRGFLPVAELFMSLRALFPVETGGGLRVCVY